MDKHHNAINLAFNPDTMTVSDLKAAATTLRSLVQRFDADISDGRSEEELRDLAYSHLLNIVDYWTTN